MIEYDLIVVGGGASGCVLAGRLAAANPNLRILIIESGPNTKDEPKHIQPLAYLAHFPPGSKTMKYYHGKMNGDRTAVVPAGNCLGGGSSVNLMVYTRGSASDYDDWKNVYGNEGWGSDDLIPLLKKTETYLVKEGQDRTHGYDGPLKVSVYEPSKNVLANQFIDLVKQYDKKSPLYDDVNELSVGNGWSRWARWVDPKTGKRQDTAHCFVYNNLDATGLQVLTEHQVIRVMIEGNRAAGVEYVSVTDPAKTVLQARAKLVVLAAGSLSTPSILERSGIGRADILRGVGIEPIVELPGVGENYHDHNSVMIPYLADNTIETIDANHSRMARNRPRQNAVQVSGLLLPSRYSHFHTAPPLSCFSGMDFAGKIRPTQQELNEMGPEFQQRWKNYFENAPDKPVLWMGVLNGYAGDRTGLNPGGKYFSTGYYLAYPASVGHVHIKSTDIDTPPDFDTGFLNHPADLAPLIWGYKRIRELARRVPAYRGFLSQDQPHFSETSKHKTLDGINSDSAVPVDTPDFVYSFEDNEAIKSFVQSRLATTWHSLGTCAMKPRHQNGVVDNKLNVYGIKGLKVADMSICPSNVGGNTYSTALLIGEKATETVAAELGIKL
ncbi:hypothetical protein D9758_007605 [Tetrapyrgos nigripes]|uniref:Glucose-methanol-choline oxidoreductase N-terminal domain-containing protein n=1 Tax=Tetrapyrgos nigripes TaxID=182062 RepID=A0A8H5LK30_9AGAR|nr:hypothetical protein D9758_007605 [Tetrapyrgos nigripes]